ncbi:MAG TPA: GNAT family N-acetyltransferase [Gemmataceae bacterium]|nr:GNAT family N-acetyltransferase [Gemmataceae bacterium]
MRMEVVLVQPDDVRALRELYRQEMNCQIVLDSWHGRGWADSYLFRLDGRVVGYGLVGGVHGDPKDVITEFYVLPAHRAAALPLFERLAAASRARSIEVQTNDVLLTLMLFDCASRIESNTVLFHDALATNLAPPGAEFRTATDAERAQIASQKLDADAGWVIEVAGAVVAAGGILFHYNVPYGDIYMAVAEPFRRRGYGSYLVQELKRTCYEMGKIPAARCNASNAASRATLQKAGMLPCARVLTGVITDRVAATE